MGMSNDTNKAARKHSDFARDFSAKTRRALLKAGITVDGICSIPDMSSEMPYANAARGYQLNDNGTSKIREHGEVISLAEAVSR